MDPSRLHAEVLTLAGLLGLDPLELAVLGGEDYALVGTVGPSDRATLEQALPDRASIIGQVRTGKKLTLNGRALDHGGFDHFSKR
ncbi:MAG: hypothetical protein EOM25_09750 [Deltaproteobacteria bacterium]|nr:hypothetical protein [Deltaproteobacteria bacterium]